ncbi:MAG: hypothetical protein CMI08_17960 [Oceanospirillaceae bacterium]|uniref:hypothetical protein n=1 Tax=unclassified Thalassolituus TaxID=2624967 RepID=UPI000C5AF207|nr:MULTISPECIES: hypothetical protein [unclassified Thalassolituus]MAY01052.1 hypothetical protein [Oceanospirillaceae bacterium]MBS53384.1 hypothetical protein [Oceanospirillaceae bacterium]|tara:strand:+ start:1308 stop:2117 length:810 start_codon:yes stop_codon:yes gene_type:complete
MLQGLSRKTLNIIILVCLVAITWLQLMGKEDEQAALEPLKLPPLHDAGWQSWANSEGVSVWFQSGGTIDGGTLVIRGAHNSSTHLTLPAASWTIPLHQGLATAPSEEPAVILINGPWSDIEKQAMAALIIREQKLQPMPTTTESWQTCIRQHLPGALWLAQQQGMEWQQLGQLPQQLSGRPLQAPELQEWAVWRLQQSRELRRNWQDEQTRIDIQADLAYHRLPAGTYADLYTSLADAYPQDVTQAVDCLRTIPVATTPAESNQTASQQ